MEVKNAGVINLDPPRFYECGPLLLDGAKSAAFYGGIQLRLTGEEYDTLFILAVNRNTFIPLNQLCESAWHSGGHEAAAGANNLMKIINRAAGGAVIIAYQPEKGYILNTFYHPETEKRRTDRMYAAIKLVSAVAVAVAVMAVSVKLYAPPARYRLKDDEVPLGMAETEKNREISFPDIKTAAVISGTDMDINLYNPEGNAHYISFEIVINGISLYVSGAVAPGDAAKGIVMESDLAEGEYLAELIMRAYDPTDYVISGEMKKKFIVKIEN